MIVAGTAAELGNQRCYIQASTAMKMVKFEDAFTWFTKGAALVQSESIAELAVITIISMMLKRSIP